MKSKFKMLLSVLLTMIIVFSAAGCGDSGQNNTSDTSKTSADNGVGDDFFADIESQIGDNTSKSGGSGKTTASQSSGGGKTVPAENTVGGKSWEQVLASMPKSLRGSTIVVANWNPSSEYTGANIAIKEFEKQTGIKVDWQVIQYGVYTTRLATMVASNNSPDVVRTRTPNPAWMQSFQPLDAAKYDFSDAAWDQILMKDYTVNGKVYATSLKNTHIGSVNMMFYNKDLINKYNYEDPYQLWKSGKWTMEKFISMCKAYKKDSGADFGCVGAYWEAWSELYGIPGPVGYKDSMYYSLLDNKDFLTVTQKIADWYHVDKILAWGRAEIFDAGDSLFYAGASVYLRRNNSYFGSLKSAGTLYAVPMPAIDGQDKYYQGRDEYEAYAIAKGAKNPQAVPYFLRYFLDGANYDLSNFFCNKQNLSVYNWCMSQPNTIWSTYYENPEDDFADGKKGIFSLQGSQIKSFIDSNRGVIDNRVKNFNKLVSQLQK